MVETGKLPTLPQIIALCMSGSIKQDHDGRKLLKNIMSESEFLDFSKEFSFQQFIKKQEKQK